MSGSFVFKEARRRAALREDRGDTPRRTPQTSARPQRHLSSQVNTTRPQQRVPDQPHDTTSHDPLGESTRAGGESA